MSNFLEDLNIPKDIQEPTESSVFEKIDKTGLYTVKIKKAYFEQSRSSKARKLVIIFEGLKGGLFTFEDWICNGSGDTFSINKEGKKVELRGFNRLKALNFFINNINGLPDVKLSKIKLYNFQAKAEIIEEKMCIPSWFGKTVNIILVRTAQFKQIKTAEGTYINSENETFTKLELQHILDINNRTFKEARENKEASSIENIRTIYDLGNGKNKSDFIYDRTGGIYKQNNPSIPTQVTKEDIFGESKPDIIVNEEEIPF